jgi:membrane protease YdiL (CAAX protease family)
MKVVIRSVLLGLVVMAAANVPWSILAAANLRVSPRIPWCIPIVAVYLAVILAYLNGSGPPASTRAFRHDSLRIRWLNAAEWRWSLTAGGLSVIALWLTYAALGNLDRHVPISREAQAMPAWALISALITSAAVTAIAEESGFRGYMQVNIENRFGVALAVGVSTVMFVMVHLTHGIAPLLKNGPYYALAGCVYGLLAHLTRSILPSLALHFAGDILTFGLRLSLLPISVPQIASLAVVLLIVAAAAGAAGVLAFARLWRMVHSRRPHGPALSTAG